MTSSLYGDITPTQYESALRWLDSAQLLDEFPGLRAPARVLVYEQAVLQAEWFQDSDVLVQGADELPMDAVAAASALGIEVGEAFDHLCARWGKVDAARRDAVGSSGEAALLALLKAELVDGTEVVQVSAWSDSLGYDIAVSGDGIAAHLEVKSTTRDGRATFYLSRNEYETMRRDRSWVLVFVRLSSDLRLAAVDTVETGWIGESVPTDRAIAARWESCRFDVPESSRARGIPAIAALVRSDASHLA